MSEISQDSASRDQPDAPKNNGAAAGDRPSHTIMRSVPQPAVTAGREIDVSSALANTIDRMIHAAVSRATGGLSPAAVSEAYLDWITHLAASPGRQVQLSEKAFRKLFRFGHYWTKCMLAHNQGHPQPCIEPLATDRRFAADAWQQPPFSLIYQMFLLQQQWWHNATTDVRGVDKQHERVVEFSARQLLDVFSPANFPITNPEVLNRTMATGGANLIQGAFNFVEDWERIWRGKKPLGAEKYRPGETVATTPGKVVYRNRLMELIQYEPTTEHVRAEPILIVPAWIMKYYILDLSSHNSLVRYLVNQGFTVFMISWKNPGAEDRDLCLEDYRTLGPMAAIDVITEIVADVPIHAAGYCLGGTLLAITAAAMARDGDERLKSISLLAAQTDFTDAGELMLFINESQIAFLEDTMWEQGYLDTRQMSGAFQLLRSSDLIWSKMVRDYWMGEREPMTDLMAWNADTTRMPHKMHSEYLRSLFLNNDLAEGRFVAGGAPVGLSDIHVPVFAVGTEWDHVAPWKSVFKIHLYADADVTFLLTSGGHNAGIVSELGHNGRQYRTMTKGHAEPYVSPEAWLEAAPAKSGSWWPEWSAWLDRNSSSIAEPPPSMGTQSFKPLCNAPGFYVQQE